jgi:large subunit ribosomal protein L22
LRYDYGISSGNAVLAGFAAKGAPGAQPDQRAQGGRGTQHAALYEEACAPIGKLLQSALDNANFLSAEKTLDVDIDNLYVKSAIANDGPRMKRIRPAPQGRAYRYQRRIAHIELVLADRGNGRAQSTVAGSGAAVPVKRRAPAAKKSAGAGKKKAAAK